MKKKGLPPVILHSAIILALLLVCLFSVVLCLRVPAASAQNFVRYSERLGQTVEMAKEGELALAHAALPEGYTQAYKLPVTMRNLSLGGVLYVAQSEESGFVALFVSAKDAQTGQPAAGFLYAERGAAAYIVTEKAAYPNWQIFPHS